MNDTRDSALRSGYLSPESKKTFTLVAGVLGALFFLLQFLLPMGAMLAIMPLTFARGTIESFDVRGSAYFRGEVYLVESSSRFADAGAETRNRLVRVAPGSSEIVEVAQLDDWEPRLLAAEDRLWLLSSSRVAHYDGARLEEVEVPAPLGDISLPFLLDGAPAVVERRPDGERLKAWDADGWRVVRMVHGTGKSCCMQVLPSQQGLLLFREDGESLYVRDLDDDAAPWVVVGAKPSHWYAFLRGTRPAVAALASDRALYILAEDGNRWTREGATAATRGFQEAFAVFEPKPGEPLVVVTSAFAGSLKVQRWDGASFLDEQRLGATSPFPGGMMSMMFVAQLAPALLSLVLAVILSSLMRTHRVGSFEHEGRRIPYASLTRRAVSQLVDAILAAGPLLFLFVRMFGDLESMVGNENFPFRFFGLLAGGAGWALLTLLAFSLGEAYWGSTPGKWAVGIRVVGTDLEPCGFGRALIRNILKFVDGFFNFLIGILMVAYTPEWQRLGDLAARTVVVRAPRGGLRALRDQTFSPPTGAN